jgi:hypothetical protein
MTAKVIYFADSRASLLQHANQVNVLAGLALAGRQSKDERKICFPLILDLSLAV